MSDESEPVCAGLTCIRHEFALRQRVDALTAKLAEAGDVINSARAAYEDDLRKRDELAGDRARRMDAELESAYAARDDARSDRGVWKGRALVAEVAGGFVDARRVREAEAECDGWRLRCERAESLRGSLAAELEAMRAERDEARAPGVSFEREGDGRWIAGVDALPGVLVYGATRAEALASVQALARSVIAERDEWRKRALAAEATAPSTEATAAATISDSVSARIAGCLNSMTRERDAWKERAEAAEAAITWTKLERDDSADRERLAIAEWHRVRDERDALVPRVRDGWDAEHTALRRELEHVRKDRDALRTRLTATFKALTGEP